MNIPMKILLASDIILNLYLWCMTEPFRSWLWQGCSKMAICLWSVTVRIANHSAGLCRRGWHMKAAVSIFIKEWHHCNYFGVELRFVGGTTQVCRQATIPDRYGYRSEGDCQGQPDSCCFFNRESARLPGGI